MAFLRRGNVGFPHKDSSYILLHRHDGMAVKFRLKQIQCWEEHQYRAFTPVVVVYWDFASSTAVRESFNEIVEMVERLRAKGGA